MHIIAPQFAIIDSIEPQAKAVMGYTFALKTEHGNAFITAETPDAAEAVLKMIAPDATIDRDHVRYTALLDGLDVTETVVTSTVEPETAVERESFTAKPPVEEDDDPL